MERRERRMENMRIEMMRMEKTRMEMAGNREGGLERTKMEWNIVLNSPTLPTCKEPSFSKLGYR